MENSPPGVDHVSTETTSNLSIARNAKIGLFHIGSSLADILALSVWNRVAIVELGLAATPIALLLSLRYFLAPLSAWVGHLSETRAWWGYRRLPYIWGGRLLMVVSCFMLGLSTVSLEDNHNGTLGWVGIVVALILFSIGSAFSGGTFLALIYDVAPAKQRTRAVSVVWFFLIAGFPIAGIAYGILLKTYTREAFLALFLIAPLVMAALWFFSLINEEKPTHQAQTASEAEKAKPSSFMRDLKTVMSNGQTRAFFLFLGLTSLFFYTQDTILEPFGGQVFGMSVQVTTRFTSYWGTMTLISILVCLWLARRYPTLLTNTTLARWSVISLAVVFGVFFICAIMQIRGLVTIGLILLGLGLGIWTVGTLGMMMDMTRAWGAGLYLSLWTVSETVGRGLGVLIGGVIRDVVLGITNQLPIAYGSVFLFQTLGFLATLLILSRVSVEAFHQQTPSTEAVLSSAMD